MPAIRQLVKYEFQGWSLIIFPKEEDLSVLRLSQFFISTPPTAPWLLRACSTRAPKATRGMKARHGISFAAASIQTSPRTEPNRIPPPAQQQVTPPKRLEFGATTGLASKDHKLHRRAPVPAKIGSRVAQRYTERFHREGRRSFRNAVSRVRT